VGHRSQNWQYGAVPTVCIDRFTKNHVSNRRKSKEIEKLESQLGPPPQVARAPPQKKGRKKKLPFSISTAFLRKKEAVWGS
jgi:hypothetical protein